MNIIIPVLGTFGKGGGWRVLSKFADEWIALGHNVVFLVSYTKQEPYFPTKAAIKYYNLKGEILESCEENVAYPIYKFFAQRSALIKALDKTPGDVILATHSYTAYPVLKTKNNAKKVYYVQAYEPNFYENPGVIGRFFKGISKKSYSLGLEIVTNSPSLALYTEQLNNRKTVPPGVDFSLFNPGDAPAADLRQKAKIVLGTIGRTEAIKGTRYIFDAFKVLNEKYPGRFELHVAFNVFDDIEKLGNVVHVVPDGDKELGKYYRDLDIYICAGYVELDAIHYPVLESMASKTALVTTGYFPSNEKNSWMAEPQNVASIVARVEAIINSDPEAIEKKTNTAAQDVKVFDWRLLAKQFVEILIEK